MNDRGAAWLSWTATALVMGVFLLMMGDIVWRGAPQLSWAFLLEAPSSAGRAGGIGPILVATLWILLVALGTAVPLGVASAVWLSEFSRANPRRQRLVRLSLDTLAGVPSIVFGLFGNAFFALTLGLGFSILSGGLTLACMALPILIRTAEEGLRAVSPDLRQQALALGMSHNSFITRLLLPAALPALSAGVLLGIGRALAETAALIFTSGYVDRMPGSLLDSARALSVHIYDLSMNVPGGEPRAYASALVLVLLIVLINAAVLGLASVWRRRIGWSGTHLKHSR